MSQPLLELRGVTVQIRERTILDTVDLLVDQGQCVALVGETGSGKSMTCRVVNGQLDRIGAQVSAGTARFDDTDLLRCSKPAWRQLRGRSIASIPQSSMSSLNPVRTVGSQMRETIRELEPRTPAKDRSAELLDLVRIRDVARVLRAYPHQLSGGMRQRVMIALALAGRPRLLVADEPTTALDVTVQHEILDLVDGLRKSIGLGLVLVTHDLGLASTIADDVIVLYRGRAVEHGPAGRVLHQPTHPYTQSLISARPSAATRGTRLGVSESRPA